MNKKNSENSGMNDGLDDEDVTGQKSHKDGNSGIDNRIAGEDVPAPPDERTETNLEWPQPDRRHAKIL
ncbi:hypothetical protein [uncultured Oxalicibacterium sp.]|uniref:hypothetical protein n=1 Tax=uncultured Oxalicibacterium sp. TaxID=1168540 RepID=UPI0025EC42E4|nr:hypothetical protein [uncultured Oxalicibacterium sp.]